MNNFLALLWGWIRTAWTAAKSATPIPTLTPVTTTTQTPAGPTTTTTEPTLQQKLESLIAHENGSEGPFPKTGGVIHAIGPATISQVARLIIEYANPAEGLPVSLFAAWIRNESNFDPGALNPNNEKAQPGETAQQAFLHTDIGIGQIDGKELSAYPDLEGMDWQDMQATACDATWSVPAMSDTCLGLVAWAKSEHASYAGAKPWGDDYHILAAQGYNSGRTGSLKPGASYAYGQGVVKRWAEFATALGA